MGFSGVSRRKNAEKSPENAVFESGMGVVKKWAWRDSNPHGVLPQWILSPQRLPIPPQALANPDTIFPSKFVDSIAQSMFFNLFTTLAILPLNTVNNQKCD